MTLTSKFSSSRDRIVGCNSEQSLSLSGVGQYAILGLSGQIPTRERLQGSINPHSLSRTPLLQELLLGTAFNLTLLEIGTDGDDWSKLLGP
jgi:hypothetical protein